jgi:drug/metabolite transporter (DMT)-like permease
MNQVIRTWLDQRSPQAKYWIGAGLVLIGAVGFSAKAVIIKMSYQYPVDFVSLLSLRMLFSMPFYALVAWSLTQKTDHTSLTKQQWVSLATLGILGYYVASILDFWGLQYITASVERLILFIYPTIVLVASAIMFKRKITGIQYLSLVLTYLGIYCAFAADIAAGVQQNLAKGAVLIFLSAFTYAIYLVFSGNMIPKVGSVKFTCYAMLFAGVAVLINCQLVNGLDLFHFPKQVYYLSFLMAIIATVVPTFMVAEGMNLIGASNTSLIAAVGPISTIVLAYFVLGERVASMQIVGTIIVLIGVLMISWKGEKS